MCAGRHSLSEEISFLQDERKRVTLYTESDQNKKSSEILHSLKCFSCKLNSVDMKIYITISLLALIIFASCSKHVEEEVIAPSAKTDLLTAISSNWELYMYVIATDKEYYYLTGPELTNHSLYKLSFDRTGGYNASNPLWSGTYRFLGDSTHFILEPTARDQIDCTLHIDNISNKKMQISSPWVQVNPEKPGASDYERFIAYQASTYLSVHQIDISNIKSVKLQLRYVVE